MKGMLLGTRQLLMFFSVPLIFSFGTAFGSSGLLGSSLSLEGATLGEEPAPENISVLGKNSVSRQERQTWYQRLLAIIPDETLALRGAQDVALYAKRSPAVVLIFAGDISGSGSVISEHGDIITNWHVIEGHRKVGVAFKPTVERKSTKFSSLVAATVLGYDEEKDLALLRIANTPNMAVVLPLGSDESTMIGTDVHAIGHPTGQYWTYTKGIVSQWRPAYRWKTEKNQHQADVIQTQTPINPGNSGGPLMNDNGELIGVNSFKASGENLNFAISVGEVKKFLARHMGPRVSRSSQSSLSGIAICEPKVLGRTSNIDDNSQELLIDLDCDNQVDAKIVKPKAKNKPIELLIDNTGNGKIDEVILDDDHDEKWDISYWDIDGDGEYDLVGHHPDGSVLASRYELFQE